MADDPVGHKAAVGAAGFKEIVGVHLRPGLQSGVTEGHNILVIHRAVFTQNVHVFPSAVRAGGVAVDYEIALSGPVLGLVEQHRTVYALGPAVDVQNHRVFLSGFKAIGLHHKAVNLMVAVCKKQRLRFGEEFAPEGCVVEGGYLAAFSVVQLLRPQIPQGHYQHFVTENVETVNGAVLFDDRSDLPLLQLVQPHAVKPGGKEIIGIAHHFVAALLAHAHIGADGIGKGEAVCGVGLHFQRSVIQGVKIRVCVDSVFAVGGDQKDEGIAQLVGQKGKALPGGADAGLLPGFQVHAVQILPAEMVGLRNGDIQQTVIDGGFVLAQLHIGYGKAFFAEPGQALASAVIVVQTAVSPPGIGSAVPPPGNLLHNFIVLIVLAVFQIGFPELRAAGVQLLITRENRSDQQQISVFHGNQLLYGDGEGVGKLGLAAGNGDTIVFRLGCGRLLFLPVAREQNGIAALPAEGGLLPKGGQPAVHTVLAEAEKGLILVLFLDGIGDDIAGGFSIRRKGNIG